ncbi:MAG TPA: ABC transporter permease [Geminicoccus sp.]|uniref:ABC transporter permease n=1 Tax=Geminicoccus sp. TaxID=2024832 RepID=UPI002E3200F1|nr:ABC transporter permease [Geminicoccus sp.]HEX2529198.1 ABC transporter permease [Geminicoccus sp.]
MSRRALQRGAVRAGAAVLTLLAASVLVFLVLQVLPGDPAAVMLGTEARPDTLVAMRREMGLDEPMAVRWWNWIGGFVTGDLGRSHTYDVPVADLITSRAEVSVPLALMSLTVAVGIGIPAGLFAAARHGRPADIVTMAAAQIGLSIPSFWIGILLVLLFTILLRWMPAGGFPGWEAGPSAALASLVLPSLALGLPQAAVLARVSRTAVVETSRLDFVRTGRAGGLTRDQAILSHALPNALPAIVTVVGLQFSFLIAGTVLVENVFYLPGLGRLVFQSIGARDLPTLMSVIMLLVATVVLVNLAVDLLLLRLDPRLAARA